jgi:hypothetical protein
MTRRFLSALLMCPSLAGTWSCELFVNGGKEDFFHETLKIEERRLSEDHMSYDFAGYRIEARGSATLQRDGASIRCLDATSLRILRLPGASGAYFASSIAMMKFPSAGWLSDFT